jgi:hypothetical protein
MKNLKLIFASSLFVVAACSSEKSNSVPEAASSTLKFGTFKSGEVQISCTQGLSDQFNAVLTFATTLGEWCRKQNIELAAAGQAACSTNYCAQSIIKKELAGKELSISGTFDRKVTSSRDSEVTSSRDGEVTSSSDSEVTSESSSESSSGGSSSSSSSSTETKVGLVITLKIPLGRPGVQTREMTCVNPINDANVLAFSTKYLASEGLVKAFNKACGK